MGKITASMGFCLVDRFSHSCLVILSPDLGGLEAILGTHSWRKVQVQRNPQAFHSEITPGYIK